MIDQQNVKNVILDLGGVLVDIEPSNTVEAFKRIMQPDIYESINWEDATEALCSMEVGKWDKSQFFGYFKKICKPSVIEEEIIDAWNAMVLEFPHERVEMVKSLAQKYNLFLLSNTNEIHISCFEQDFKNRYHIHLPDLFSKVFYSSEIGFRKPHAESFHYVLNHAGIIAEETVMVDDREDNCRMAESIGMQSIKVPENSGLEAVIGELL